MKPGCLTPRWLVFTLTLTILSGAVVAQSARTMLRTIQTQTSIARRVATEAERRAAIQNAQAVEKRLQAEEKKSPDKPKVRYIAVRASVKASAPAKSDTPSKGQTAKKDDEKKGDQPKNPAAKANDDVDVMIYDRLSGGTVNKYIYTLPREPQQKVSVKLDDYEALYVGR